MTAKKSTSKASKAAPKKGAASCDSGVDVKKTEKKKRKPGPGRPNGMGNKTTTAAKEIIVALVDKLAPDVEKKMEMLEPKDWLAVYVKLLDYVMPKLAPASESPKGNEENMERLFKAAAKVMGSNA